MFQRLRRGISRRTKHLLRRDTAPAAKEGRYNPAIETDREIPPGLPLEAAKENEPKYEHPATRQGEVRPAATESTGKPKAHVPVTRDHQQYASTSNDQDAGPSANKEEGSPHPIFNDSDPFQRISPDTAEGHHIKRKPLHPAVEEDVSPESMPLKNRTQPSSSSSSFHSSSSSVKQDIPLTDDAGSASEDDRYHDATTGHGDANDGNTLENHYTYTHVSQIPHHIAAIIQPTGQEVHVDHTIHYRPPITHEVIRPQVHTIYEPRRVRSIHLHERTNVIQPILDRSRES